MNENDPFCEKHAARRNFVSLVKILLVEIKGVIANILCLFFRMQKTTRNNVVHVTDIEKVARVY